MCPKVIAEFPTVCPAQRDLLGLILGSSVKLRKEVNSQNLQRRIISFSMGSGEKAATRGQLGGK
jgi:hypothetical protein